MSYYDQTSRPFRQLVPHLVPEVEPEGPMPPIHEPDWDLSKIDHYGNMCFVIGWGDGSIFRSLALHCTERMQHKKIIFVLFGEELQDFRYSLKHKLFPDWVINLNIGIMYAGAEDSVMLHAHHLSSDHTQIPTFGGLNFLTAHELNPLAEEARRKYMEQFPKLLEEKLHFPGNCPDDAFDGIRNSLLNLPRLIDKPSPIEYTSIFGQDPVFCVGSGPHIKGHIEDLRREQHGAYIICAESAMGALLDSDIQPDIVTPMERPPITTKWLEPARGTNVWFGGICVVPPAAVDCFDDRTLFVPGSDKVIEWVDPSHELSRMWTGHTTVVLGFALARTMADGPVYLVGQDLALGEAGESHWDKVARYSFDKAQFYTGEECKIPGNSGGMVRSTKIWHTVLTQLTEINRQMVQNAGMPPALSVMAHDQVGAAIPGFKAAPFPRNLPKIDKVDWRKFPPNTERKDYFRQCLEILPHDFAASARYFRQLASIAVGYGTTGGGRWKEELAHLARAATVIGGITGYSRSILRYFYHNFLYNAALQINMMRTVKNDFQACCRIAEGIRCTVLDMARISDSYVPKMEDACRRAQAIL